jgi:hypothetical protein
MKERERESGRKTNFRKPIKQSICASMKQNLTSWLVINGRRQTTGLLNLQCSALATPRRRSILEDVSQLIQEVGPENQIP